MHSQDVTQRMMGTSPAQRLRLQAVAAEFLERMGQRLRARREELGLARSEVARRMPGRVSENQIYRWEMGKHNPHPDTLEELAKVLDRDVAYFMAPVGLEGERAPQRAAPDLLAQLNPDVFVRPQRIEEALEQLADRQDRLIQVIQDLTSARVQDATVADASKDEAPNSRRAPTQARGSRRRPTA